MARILPEEGPWGFEILCELSTIEHEREMLSWCKDLKRHYRFLSRASPGERDRAEKCLGLIETIEASSSENLFRAEEELKEFRDKHFHWMRRRNATDDS